MARQALKPSSQKKSIVLVSNWMRVASAFIVTPLVLGATSTAWSYWLQRPLMSSARLGTAPRKR
jgi:hypothetical protein